MNLDFAVVICAYSVERWDRLVRAVQSVQEQTLPPREVIVVVDHNEALCGARQGLPDGVRVVENSQPRGLRGARNSGLLHANGVVRRFHRRRRGGICAVAGNPGRNRTGDPEVAGVGGLTEPIWSEGGRSGLVSTRVRLDRRRGLPRNVAQAAGCPKSLGAGICRSVEISLSVVADFELATRATILSYAFAFDNGGQASASYSVPEAIVLHHVERSRMTVRRYLSRCYFEGGSKAVISRLIGREDGLASECRYTREVLPSGVKQAMLDFVWRSDRAGVARAG